MMIGIVSRLTDQKGFDLVALCDGRALSGCCADRGTRNWRSNNMRICSVILHGSIRIKYLRIFIIPKRCRIRFMHPVMHS